ncbi:MAG: ribonuclease PH [Trueperaceae bacterium]
MREGRSDDQLRPIRLTHGVNRWAEGSALVEWGDTRVQATVTVEDKLPPHLRGGKHRGGWLTAEYALLPRATGTRRPRERLHASGRTVEIQRLIGRALRTAVDLNAVPKRTMTVDVDVLQADGGTRCAGIVAGHAALREWADRQIRAGTLSEWPLRCDVTAVSVGLLDGRPLTDLDYREDDAAELDLNVVASADGRLIEVQGGSEGEPIDAETYVTLVARGVRGAQAVMRAVESSLP